MESHPLLEEARKDPDFLRKLDKLAIVIGDITTFHADVLVNSSNEELIHGAGVDGVIRKKAGPELDKLFHDIALHEQAENRIPCAAGKVIVTPSYNLKANFKAIFHTVGPQDKNVQLLESCYVNCLNEMKRHDYKSIVFPCISVGNNKFSAEEAAIVAISSVLRWLGDVENRGSITGIVFCCLAENNLLCYQKVMEILVPRRSTSRERY